MHAECFTKYEDALVNFMSKQGRGRTWNDKQVRLHDSRLAAVIIYCNLSLISAVRKYVEHQGLRYHLQEM